MRDLVDYTVTTGKYLGFCRNRKNLDSKTIKAYGIDLKQYIKFVDSRNIEWNKKASIEIFLDQLYTQYKPKSVKRKIASIKAFFHYLELENIIEANPFHKIQIKYVRRSLEEYLAAKGCKKGVSITVKQMETPQIYNILNDHKAKVYTAFRDYRTYASKHRNETWGKEFTISKNSDFVISIEKDYYIFNFVEKKHLDTGLYQNENTNFYEHYNSGITCTIYSCIRKKRTLFGFLACDSLFDKKDREKAGPDIFDWKAANIMMHAAQIIAMYLQLFYDVWDRYCIYFKAGKAVKGTEKTCREQIAYLEELIKQIKVEDEKKARIKEKEELEDMVAKNNFCRVIRDTVEKRRYNN